jgi:VanZ family protein
MKTIKTLLLLAILAVGTTNAQTGYLGLSEETMQFDKQQHAFGGIALGFVSFVYFDSVTDDFNNKINTELQAYFKSATFVLGISLLKEANDKYLGGRAFDVGDIGSAMFGHFMGATTAYIIRDLKKKRELKLSKRQAEKIAKIDSFYK